MAQEPEFLEEAAPNEPSMQERLLEYAAVLWKRRRLILLSMVVAVLVAALFSVLAAPSYLATTVLAVEREMSSPLDPNWHPQLYSAGDLDFLPTQVKLLQSREIAQRVVRKLNLLENRVLNPTKGGLFQDEKKSAPGTKLVPAAEADVIGMAGFVQGNIDVEIIKGTNLLNVSCEAPSPELAADIANAVAESYIEWIFEAKTQIVTRASEFFAAQTQQLRKELDSLEQQLLAYGRQKNIVSVDPQMNVTGQVESLNRDYAAAVADRVAKEARYHEVDTSTPEAIADTLSGGLTSQLHGEQLRLERDYAERLNLFKPEWPAMQQLKAQIDKGREHFAAVVQETIAKAREAAKSEYLTALRREENLKTVLGAQKSEAMTLNSNAVEYNNLKIQVEAKRSMLDSLLKRQAETEALSRISGEGETNVRVVDKALLPGRPYKPAWMKNLVLGAFAGGMVGVGLAFFLSFLDRSLRTSEQVEQQLGLPSLGVIPAVGAVGASYAYRGFLGKRKKEGTEEIQESIELLPHRAPRSSVAERYRDLRTALLLSRAGGVKSIVVTSCVPREGKTSTAVNLAVVLGQLGKPVLLVDADLHRPRLHEILRVPNRIGLVSILAGNVDPARAIVKTDIPEVSVIPAGPASPNPSGLLSSEAMSRFLSLAQMNFDYVILDAPPVMPVADALVLGNQTDGVVLCVKGGKTPREQVARVRDKLYRSNVRILGVVINDLAEEKTGYRDHYGYEDGYPGQEPADSAERVSSHASTV
jgi:succinoglycan biosynthesis transport protein ExoP